MLGKIDAIYRRFVWFIRKCSIVTLRSGAMPVSSLWLGPLSHLSPLAEAQSYQLLTDAAMQT